MKKSIFILLVLALCANLDAAITRKAIITFTSDQGGEDELKVFEDNTATRGFDNSKDISKVFNGGNTTNLNIYVSAPDCTPKDLSTVVTNKVLHYPVVIQTNQVATNYTFAFSKVVGELYLYDAVEDSIFVMKKDSSYHFTAAANSTITDRFIIEPLLSFTRDLKAEKVGTICWPYAIAVADITGASIWEPIQFNETSVSVAQVTDSLKAAVPYFFIATDNEQVFKYRPLGKVSEAGTNNGMHGAFEKMDVQRGNYIAYENGILCVGNGCYIVANRAYFVASECQPTQAPGRKVRWLNTPGASMGVEELPADLQTRDAKLLINGQFIILKNGRMFNAQGQEL